MIDDPALSAFNGIMSRDPEAARELLKAVMRDDIVDGWEEDSWFASIMKAADWGDSKNLPESAKVASFLRAWADGLDHIV